MTVAGSNLPSTRSAAAAVGSRMYYTGKPCTNGHVSARYTQHGNCAQCQADYRVANVGVVKAAKDRWVAKNRDHVRATWRAWYRTGGKLRLNLEPKRAYRQRWRKKNPGLVRYQQALRRAALLRATPPWADLGRIKQIYIECPPGFHVDHIEPLRGTDVCGLHVESNLRIIPSAVNLKKGNRRHVSEDTIDG